MNIDDTNWSPYKQYSKDGVWHNLCADDDLYEIDVITDDDGNILSEEETGQCGCRSCREAS